MAVVMKFINAAALITGGALAASPAVGGCSKLSPMITEPIVEDFVRNPNFVLIAQRDMDKLAAAIGEVVTYDSRKTLPLVIQLARSGSEDQRAAIGAGLGGAALQCDLPQPQTSRIIRDNVQLLHDTFVSKAFDEAYGTFAGPNTDMLGGRGSTLGNDSVSASTPPVVASGGIAQPDKDDGAPASRLQLNMNSRTLANPFAPIPLPDPSRKLDYSHIAPGT